MVLYTSASIACELSNARDVVVDHSQNPSYIGIPSFRVSLSQLPQKLTQLEGIPMSKKIRPESSRICRINSDLAC